jgi:hypothetical protein
MCWMALLLPSLSQTIDPQEGCMDKNVDESTAIDVRMEEFRSIIHFIIVLAPFGLGHPVHLCI